MSDPRLFPKLSQHQIECAIEAGEILNLADGQTVFREGDASADFYVVLDGKLKITRRGGGAGEVVLVVHEPGQFTGATDLLTGEAVTATGFAVGPTRVVRVPGDRLRELVMACPELRSLLIPIFTERRAAQFAIQTQQQKLAALGKMSAGLAHELNNPASAASRSAQALTHVLGEVESLCCELLNAAMTRAGGDTVPLKKICEIARSAGGELDPLARSDLEQELGDWLELQSVPNPWDSAAALVSAGVRKQHLEPLAATSNGQLPKLLTWLARDIEMHVLCRDLEQSTTRISDLVGAMKSYTYMDRGQAKAPTDLRQGIDTTLTILKHKLKKKAVQVTREYGEVPPVPAFGGELNQVWTNLIDNAIDAVPTGGHIVIRTTCEGNHAFVEVIDDGSGIAPESQSRIFEPFFTTKGVGQGTGLGLDTTYRIVRNHQGDIRFESRPGRTRFMIWLPLQESSGGPDGHDVQARESDPAGSAAVGRV